MNKKIYYHVYNSLPLFPKPYESSRESYFKVYFNIIFWPTPRYLKSSLPFRLTLTLFPTLQYQAHYFTYEYFEGIFILEM